MADDPKPKKIEPAVTVTAAPATVRLRCIIDRCFAENDKSYPVGEEFDASPAVADAMIKARQAEKI